MKLILKPGHLPLHTDRASHYSFSYIGIFPSPDIQREHLSVLLEHALHHMCNHHEMQYNFKDELSLPHLHINDDITM